MHLKDNYKILSYLLIFISFSSFFLGFYLDENSAGAGSYLGDWKYAWPNIQLFINQNVYDSIHSENYLSNRPPLLYILHKLFNPFVETEMGYRRSVFIVSLATPFLFYFCLKQKFKEIDGLLLFLISSVVLLSPYYRTSAYWGLEENYSFISLLLSFLFLNYFLLPFSFYDLEFVYSVINLYYYIINLLESYVQRQIILLLSKLYFAT